MKNNFNHPNLKVEYKRNVQARSLGQDSTGTKVPMEEVNQDNAKTTEETGKLPNQAIFLNACRGQSVKIYFLTHVSPLEAELLWFDLYCIGVKANGAESMIFKHALESVEKC